MLRLNGTTMGDSPHAQRASSVPRGSSNYDKRYHHRRSIISLRARHLRVEEDTTDNGRATLWFNDANTVDPPQKQKQSRKQIFFLQCLREVTTS